MLFTATIIRHCGILLLSDTRCLHPCFLVGCVQLAVCVLLEAVGCSPVWGARQKTPPLDLPSGPGCHGNNSVAAIIQVPPTEAPPDSHTTAPGRQDKHLHTSRSLPIGGGLRNLIFIYLFFLTKSKLFLLHPAYAPGLIVEFALQTFYPVFQRTQSCCCCFQYVAILWPVYKRGRLAQTL